MKNTKQPLPTTNQSKKAYQQPQLRVYGDLREITQTLGFMGVFDNGLMVTKTHL